QAERRREVKRGRERRAHARLRRHSPSSSCCKLSHLLLAPATLIPTATPWPAQARRARHRAGGGNMTADSRKIFICSCDDTMPLDADAVRRGCRGVKDVATAHQLCRAEIERFRAALAEGVPITVGCTQEAPLFAEVAEGAPQAVAFANLRET